MMDALQLKFGELQQVCEEISGLAEEDDEYNCLEVAEMEVQTCSAKVAEYLESRENDPPSSGSLTSSWVEKHSDASCEKWSPEGSVISNPPVVAQTEDERDRESSRGIPSSVLVDNYAFRFSDTGSFEEGRPEILRPDVRKRPVSGSLQTIEIMEQYGGILTNEES